MFKTIHLEPYFTNNGISHINSINNSNFTGFGSSYPADDLPHPGSKFLLYNIPFIFPYKENSYDNMEFFNQEIIIPENTYSTLYILGSAENGSFEEPIVIGDTKSHNIFKIGLSDWLEEYSFFGEKIAFRCNKLHRASGGVASNLKPTIWFQKIDLGYRGLNSNYIKFNDNPSMHIFSMTLKVKEINH